MPQLASCWAHLAFGMDKDDCEKGKCHKYFLGSGDGIIYPGYFPAVFGLVSDWSWEWAVQPVFSQRCDGFIPEPLLVSSLAPTCPLLSHLCPLEFYFILLFWHGAVGACPCFLHPLAWAL